MSKRIESSGVASGVDAVPQIDTCDGTSKRNACAISLKSFSKTRVLAVVSTNMGECKDGPHVLQVRKVERQHRNHVYTIVDI